MANFQDPSSRRPGPPAVRPVARFHLTREGSYWLLVAVILWGTGLYKGINLITFLGTLMLVIWGLHAFRVLRSGRRLRQLHLRRRFMEPVFAGTPAEVEVEVENPLPADLLGFRLESPGSRGIRNWFLVRLAPGRKARFFEEITLPRRGWHVCQPLRVHSGYPFGLNERAVAFAPGDRVLVCPRLGRLHRGRLRRYLARASFSTGRTRQRPSRHPMAQSEFHGLRDFRAGDSPRLIHWRTSARRGQLMVREFEDTPNENLVLVLDPSVLPAAEPAEGKPHREIEGSAAAPLVAPAATDPLLEEAVSLAATICWEWCRQKGDRFVLAVGGHAPVVVDGLTGRDHGLLMLECLALLSGNPAPDLARLVDRLAAADLPPGPVLVISPRPGGLGEVLARRLKRPVASLDLVTSPNPDFFEKALDHAA